MFLFLSNFREIVDISIYLPILYYNESAFGAIARDLRVRRFVIDALKSPQKFLPHLFPSHHSKDGGIKHINTQRHFIHDHTHAHTHTHSSTCTQTHSHTQISKSKTVIRDRCIQVLILLSFRNKFFDRSMNV